MKVENFPFGALLKKAWQWSFQHKLLWILGIFIGGSGVAFNIQIDDWQNMQANLVSPQFIENISALFSTGWAFVFIILVFLLFLILLVISFAARASILQGINAINRSSGYKFWQLVSFGFKKTPRILLLEIILGVINLVLLAALFLLLFKFVLLGVKIIFVILLIALILYNIWLALFRHYTYCYAVLENQKAWSAIKAGASLLRKNFWVTVVARLIELGLWIAVTLGAFLAILIIAIPLILLSLLLLISIGQGAIIVMLIIGLVVFFALMLFVRGVANMYFQSYLTNVYWQLKGMKKAN